MYAIKKNKFLWLFLLIFGNEAIGEFKVYDATLYNNKPNLSLYNIHYIPVVYESIFFSNKNPDAMPDDKNYLKASEVINKLNYDFAVLDIERWVAVEGNNVDKYIEVIKRVKEIVGNTKLGFYGVVPSRNYWSSLNKKSINYIKWQKSNDKLKKLVRNVDIVFPSLYTFYSNKNSWKKYAIGQINEARRLAKGKPVIVFLWPQYHKSNFMLGGYYLSRDFWRMQLDLSFQLSDGVIIWGGWKQDWDPEAEWWKETIKFMYDNQLL